MEDRDERVPLGDERLMGADANSNSIAVRVDSPIGIPIDTTCASIVGLLVFKADGKESFASLAVGIMDMNDLVSYISEFVCDMIDDHFGIDTGMAVLEYINETVREVIRKKVEKLMEGENKDETV